MIPANEPQGRPWTISWCIAVGVGLVCTRVLLLVVLARWTGGVEFTGDVATHWSLVSNPAQLVVGHTERFGQYPPLLPFLEAAIAAPASWFLPRFHALRVTYILYEGLASFFLCLAFRALGARGISRLAVLGLLLALWPMGWMTSTVMAQDESIATCWLMLVYWLLATGRARAALLACSLGVVAAKVLLVLPLLALLGLLPGLRVRERLLLGLGPATAVHGAVVLASMARGAPLPMAGFIPRPDFGVNFWSLVMFRGGLPPTLAATVSALFAGTMLGYLLRLASRVPGTSRVGPGKDRGVRWQAGVTAASFLWSFALFYHVNPEYYLLPFYCLALAGWDLVPRSGIALASVTPWLVNLVFGATHLAGSGRVAHWPDVARSALSAVATAGGVLHPASVLINSVVTLWLAVAATRRLSRSSGRAACI